MQSNKNRQAAPNQQQDQQANKQGMQGQSQQGQSQQGQDQQANKGKQDQDQDRTQWSQVPEAKEGQENPQSKKKTGTY